MNVRSNHFAIDNIMKIKTESQTKQFKFRICKKIEIYYIYWKAKRRFTPVAYAGGGGRGEIPPPPERKKKKRKNEGKGEKRKKKEEKNKGKGRKEREKVKKEEKSE